MLILVGGAHLREGSTTKDVQNAIIQHMPNVLVRVEEAMTNRTGDFVIMWGAQWWTYTHVATVERGHIVHGTLQRAGGPDGEMWHVLNVYTPVRTQLGEESKRKDEETWNKLDKAIARISSSFWWYY